MDRKNSIGKFGGLNASRSLLHFTLYASLFTIFMLLFALSSMLSASYSQLFNNSKLLALRSEL